MSMEVDPAPGTRTSIREIADQRTGEACFLQLVHTPAPSGEVEESSFDVVVTDGAQAWTAADMDASSIKGPNNRVRHALEAFTDLMAPSEEYSYEVALGHEEPAVRCRWSQAGHGKGVTATVRIPLEPAPDPAPLVLAMLRVLRANVEGGRATQRKLEEECKDLRDTADKNLRLVETYVAEKKQQEEEIAEKVAALLNEKKRKLKQLKETIQSLAEEDGDAVTRGAAEAVAAAEDELLAEAGGYAEAEEGGSGDATPRVPSELVDAMGAEIEALEADQQEGLNPDYLDLRGNSPERDLSD